MLKRVKKLFRVLGPGLITGASDDDPSGIATYSQVGAQTGFATLWTAPLSFPLMAAVQEMSARIGLTTGHGLVGNLRLHYPRWILFPLAILVLSANTINIGADIAGMAAAANLVVPINSLVYVVIFSVFIIGAMIYLPYHRFASYLKWLCLTFFAYIAVPFIVRIDWASVWQHTLVPTFTWDKTMITMLVALFGTTISPYLFFWQADMEVADELSRGKKMRHWIVTKHEIRLMEEDVNFGMFLSQIVTWFIIITAGATLFGIGAGGIKTAADAAAALKPIAGDYAYLLFALGIIGTGLLAIPVLAGSASYVISEAFNWKNEGLDEPFSKAKGFYLVVIASTVIGASLSFFGVDPIALLFYTAVIYGVISPPLIAIILHIANNKKIMGEESNGKLSNSLVLLTLVLMTVSAAAYLKLSFFG